MTVIGFGLDCRFILKSGFGLDCRFILKSGFGLSIFVMDLDWQSMEAVLLGLKMCIKIYQNIKNFRRKKMLCFKYWSRKASSLYINHNKFPRKKRKTPSLCYFFVLWFRLSSDQKLQNCFGSKNSLTKRFINTSSRLVHVYDIPHVWYF